MTNHENITFHRDFQCSYGRKVYYSDKIFRVAVDIAPAFLNVTHHGKPSRVTHSSEA